MLRTDQSDWVRPDWFPADAISIDLSSWLAPLDVSLRKRLLYEIIKAIRPRNVFNVNSRLAFQTYETYGSRLNQFTDLFAYYFCADRAPDGREVGYPVSFFANVIPHMTGALTDTDYLRQALIDRYSLSGEMARKVTVMYTPALTGIIPEPAAIAQVASRSTRKQPVIIWAGRFDRQKRFDLLVGIASVMPNVTFKCWGTAVLDPMPSLSNLPENLIVHPPFNSYEELPLKECDGVLYTSAWDGLPTILIEFGALGMPVVASAVGGVPELIDEETGWPVDGSAGVESYVDAINDMLNSPESRVKRATSLQNRVAIRHNRLAYYDRLRSITGSEK